MKINVNVKSEILHQTNEWNERLELLGTVGPIKINSQQRRLERYRMIYIFKILEYIVPSPGISWTQDEKRGRLINIPALIKGARVSIISLREQSLQVHGAKLFNKLPVDLRNMTGVSVDTWKKHLDGFLTVIPDRPLCGDLIPSPCDGLGRVSNSLQDWIPKLFKI